MELAEKHILTLVNTMAIGKMVKDMVKEYFTTKMEIFTQVGGNLVKKKEPALIHLNQLEWSFMEIGQLGLSQKENGFIQTVCIMKEDFRIISQKVKVNGYLKMVTF